jgi:hypothetical protein
MEWAGALMLLSSLLSRRHRLARHLRFSVCNYGWNSQLDFRTAIEFTPDGQFYRPLGCCGRLHAGRHCAKLLQQSDRLDFVSDEQNEIS